MIPTRVIYNITVESQREAFCMCVLFKQKKPRLGRKMLYRQSVTRVVDTRVGTETLRHAKNTKELLESRFIFFQEEIGKPFIYPCYTYKFF